MIQSRRLLAVCRPAMILLLVICPALAEHVELSPFMSTFAASNLGGIRKVVRYETPHPNQTEIDYLLLAAPSDKPDDTPVAVQVQGLHGDDVKLVDNYFPDCTVARIGIFRQSHEVIVIKAWRPDDVQHIMGGSLAQPGSMNVQIYRRHEGGEPGQSSPIFKADAAPVLSTPVCEDSEVQKVLDDTARIAFKENAR